MPIRRTFSLITTTTAPIFPVVTRREIKLQTRNCVWIDREIDDGVISGDELEEEQEKKKKKKREDLVKQSVWEQMKEIVKFTGPAMGMWICGPLMSLIDTVVIGQGSSVELAALGKLN